jgi:hypothetical protein
VYKNYQCAKREDFIKKINSAKKGSNYGHKEKIP